MARYAHLSSGKVTSTRDALPALFYDPDSERRVACGFYNDNRLEMSSDTSERGTSDRLRLAADGTQDGSNNASDGDAKSLGVAADRSSLASIDIESAALHRAGLEPATFGSVDRCSKSITADDATACDAQEIDMSSCMSFLKQAEPDLARIAAAWPNLPDHIKATIITLIESSGVPIDASE